MNETELIQSFAGRTLNLPEEEVVELLYEKTEDGLKLKGAALEALLTKDATRIKTLKESYKEEKTKTWEQAYNKAKAETLAKFEQDVREKYSFDSEKTGIELIEELIGSKNGKSKLKDDEVKTHPVFIESEKKWKLDAKKVEDTYKQQIEELNRTFNREKTLQSVYSDVRKIFAGLNPIISENLVVAQNRERDFLSKFSEYDYQPQEDGNHIIIDKQGKRLEDEHGNPVTFQQFVKEKTLLYYDLSKEEKKNAGNRNQQTAPVKVPGTIEEYNAAIAAAKTTEEKRMINETYLKARNINTEKLK